MPRTRKLASSASAARAGTSIRTRYDPGAPTRFTQHRPDGRRRRSGGRPSGRCLAATNQRTRTTRTGRAPQLHPNARLPPLPASAQSSSRRVKIRKACRIDVIPFGGRRASAVPLVTEAFDAWCPRG
jgi:hypothetical protein